MTRHNTMDLFNYELNLEETANSTFPWLIHARRLFFSGYTLSKNKDKNNLYKDVDNVARMLLGMSVECYLKAFYVANNNKIRDNGKQIVKGRHGLKEIANDVGFNLTRKEEIVLINLSMYVHTFGRYPVPLKLENVKNPKKIINEDFYGVIFNENSEDIAINLIKKIEKKIDIIRTKKK